MKCSVRLDFRWPRSLTDMAEMKSAKRAALAAAARRVRKPVRPARLDQRRLALFISAISVSELGHRKSSLKLHFMVHLQWRWIHLHTSVAHHVSLLRLVANQDQP